MFKTMIRERVITNPKEIDKLIGLIDYYELKVLTIGPGGMYRTKKEMLASGTPHNLSDYMYIELKDTKLEITTKYYEYKNTTYKFSLNEEELTQNSGRQCFAQLSKYFKIPKAEEYHNETLDRWFDKEKGKYVCSASPILGYCGKQGEKHEYENCYEYDLNSAYFATLIKEIPDLEKPIFGNDLRVRKGFVGFNINDSLTLVEEGYADVLFPLIPAPDGLLKYVDKWYNIKKNSPKGSRERKDAKDALNLPIGYCQRYNPFLRSYVIHKCNNIIRNLIDVNTLFWNTDAIFTLKKRDDLAIGDGLGEWKEVPIAKLKYINNVYQINDDIPVYRGIPKMWFENFNKEHGRPFNLLTDDLPQNKNTYKWNWDTLKLEKIKYEEINQKTKTSKQKNL